MAQEKNLSPSRYPQTEGTVILIKEGFSRKVGLMFCHISARNPIEEGTDWRRWGGSTNFKKLVTLENNLISR